MTWREVTRRPRVRRSIVYLTTPAVRFLVGMRYQIDARRTGLLPDEEATQEECLDFFHTEPNLWRLSGPDGDAAVAANGRLRINNGQALRVAALEQNPIILVRILRR